MVTLQWQRERTARAAVAVLPSCLGKTAPTDPHPPPPSRPDNTAANPAMQRHTRCHHHLSLPPMPHHHPANTAACPPPLSHPNKAAVQSLRCHHPDNSASHPPLLWMIFLLFLPVTGPPTHHRRPNNTPADPCLPLPSRLDNITAAQTMQWHTICLWKKRF